MYTVHSAVICSVEERIQHIKEWPRTKHTDTLFNQILIDCQFYLESTASLWGNVII